MSKYPFLVKDAPKKCKKQILRALDAHPNARQKCEAGKIDEAASLLADDGRLTSAHWLVQYCRQGVRA